MELHNLSPAPGSTKKGKRIARGQGSGRGGTSTRGHKGQKSRSGYSKKRNFEGGQMPLQMRLPKRGFNSPNRQEYQVLNLSHIQHLCEKYDTTTIDVDFLKAKNIIKKSDIVKVLAHGELNKKVNITAHKCSATAQKAIEAAGGAVTLLS
ncbi:UNVERIFIED_CONTAM: hypothetical protein GTU68_004251 [Idotea baltica]|nr:hypothetical protein [Idotea baltica]